MKSKGKFARFAAAILSGLLTLACVFSASGCSVKYYHTVALYDNGALLTNPGMGWNFCYYSNQINSYGALLENGDYLDDFPCDIVYFRFGWNFIQPDEQFYNVVLKPMGYTVPDDYKFDGSSFWWELIDNVAEGWTQRGKRLAIRITANDGWGQCTPLWVKDKGSAGHSYDPMTEESYNMLENRYNEYLEDGMSPDEAHRQACLKVYNSFCEEGRIWYGTEENAIACDGRETWCPDYGDPIFLEYYEKMLVAIRDRYGEDLEFIEIGSVGTWGEGHNGRADPDVGEFIDYDAKDKAIDMFHNVFGDDYLVLTNDDLVKNESALAQKCYDYGFGCTDDSFLVAQRETGTDSYPGDFLDNFYYEGLVTAIESAPEQQPQNDLLLRSVWKNHASYLRLILDPYVMKDNAFVKDLTIQAGYRINITQARLSDMNAGKPFSVELTVRNTGAAPCYVGGYLSIKVLDGTNTVVAQGTSDWNLSQLETAESYEDALAAEGQKVTVSVDMPKGLDADRYSVCVSVVNDAGEDYIKLPLDDGYEMVYRIATFDLT